MAARRTIAAIATGTTAVIAPIAPTATVADGEDAGSGRAEPETAVTGSADRMNTVNHASRARREVARRP
jgi:hypothetical protein